MKRYGTSYTATNDGDDKNLTWFSEIFDVKASSKGSLDVNKPCRIVVEEENVINVDGDVCNNEVGLAKNVSAGVATELTKITSEEKLMKSGISLEWCLFQTMYCLLEKTNEAGSI